MQICFICLYLDYSQDSITHIQIQQQLTGMFSYIPGSLRKATRLPLKKIQPFDLPSPTDPKKIMGKIASLDTSGEFSFDSQTRSVITNWLTQCTPNILAHYNQYATPYNFNMLFVICSQYKYHQSRYYDLAEQYLRGKHKQQVSLGSLIRIYTSAVQLKHGSNTTFLKSLQKQIVGKINQLRYQGRIDRGSIHHVSFFLQGLAFSKLSTTDEKNMMLKEINPILENSVENFARFNKPEVNSLLFEICTLYDLQLNSKLMELIQKQHENLQKNTVSPSNDKKQGRDFLSIFQKIFENRVHDLGYQFDTNVIIKGRQYDFVIKGRKRQKNCPLAHINLEDPVHQMPSIDVKKVKQFSKLHDFQWIQRKSVQEKVVISLNGPYHYLISDVHPEQTISRREQFGYEKLALYGIYKYNIINYVKWQKVSQYSREVQKYIYDKINNPISLPKKL